MSKRTFITPPEICDELGISRPTFDTLVADGLPVYRLAERSIRVDRAEFERWLADRRVDADLAS